MLGSENNKNSNNNKYYKVKSISNSKSKEKNAYNNNNYNYLPDLNINSGRQTTEVINNNDNKNYNDDSFKKLKINNSSNLPKYKSRQQNNQIQQDRVLYSSYQNIYNDLATAKLANPSPPGNELLLKKLFDEQSEIIKTYKESASKLIKEREDYIRETQKLKEKINYSRNIQKNILNKLEFHNYFEKMIEQKVENLLQKSCNFDNRRDNNSKEPNESAKNSSFNRPMSQHTIRNNSNINDNINSNSNNTKNNSSSKLPVIIQGKVVKKFKTNNYQNKETVNSMVRPASSKNSIQNSYNEVLSNSNSSFKIKEEKNPSNNNDENKRIYIENDNEVLNKSSHKELDSNISSKISKLSKISKPSKTNSHLEVKKEFEKSLHEEKIQVNTEKSLKEYTNVNPSVEASTSEKKANSDKVINSKDFLTKPIKIKRNNIIRPHIPVYKGHSNFNSKLSDKNEEEKAINTNNNINDNNNDIAIEKIKNDETIKSIKENNSVKLNKESSNLNSSNQHNISNRSQKIRDETPNSHSDKIFKKLEFNDSKVEVLNQIENDYVKHTTNNTEFLFDTKKRYFERTTNTNKSVFLTGICLENLRLNLKLNNTIKYYYIFSNLADKLITMRINNEEKKSIKTSSKTKIQNTDGLVYKKKSKILLGNAHASTALSNSGNKSEEDEPTKPAYEKKTANSKNNINLKKVKLENVKKLPTINASLTSSPKARSIKSGINSKTSSVHKNNDDKIISLDESIKKIDISNENYKSKLLDMITNIKETNFEYSKTYHNQNKFSFDNSNNKKESSKTLPSQILGTTHENIEAQSIPEEEKDYNDNDNDNDNNNLDISNCNSETEKKREMNLLRNIQTPGFNKNISDDENTTKPIIIKEDPYVKSKFKGNFNSDKYNNVDSKKIEFTFKKSNIKFNKSNLDKEPTSSQFDNSTNFNNVSKILNFYDRSFQ